MQSVLITCIADNVE